MRATGEMAEWAQNNALEVCLSDPDVPIDTNHLERGIRAIPMGRRNRLFCWTELGAEHVGIIQSLVSTCRMHEVDPYAWLVDVLQRIADLSRPRRGAADATTVEGALCRQPVDLPNR